MIYNRKEVMFVNDKMRCTLTALSAILLLTATACADSDGGNGITETTAPVTETETVEAATGRDAVKDALPEKDWEGKEFRIYAYDYQKDDFIVEKETGALVNDAIYRRNQTVEDRFNVTLVMDVSMGYEKLSKTVRTSVSAGDDFSELILEHMPTMGTLASQNLFLDAHTVPYLDLANPWWLSNVSDNLTIDGKTFMFIGSISPTYTTHNYCIYFNKKHAADYDIGDSLYDKVLDGTWTIDAMSELVRGMYRDLNGDGKSDENDFYGLAQQVTSYAAPFWYGFGEITVKKDSDGMPILDFNMEKASSIVEKMYALFYENDTTTTKDYGPHTDIFLDSRALFLTGILGFSYTRFADFEDDYGILPMPKWDEAQETYYTMSDGASPLCGIPNTVRDTEFAGMITEAMAYESWRIIDPAIIDNAIKARGTRDERSVEIVDLIMNGSVCDFGYVYDVGGFILFDMMGKKQNNFASFYAKKESSWQKRLDKVIESYTAE